MVSTRPLTERSILHQSAANVIFGRVTVRYVAAPGWLGTASGAGVAPSRLDHQGACNDGADEHILRQAAVDFAPAACKIPPDLVDYAEAVSMIVQ
jgi:hypothetical protein